MTLTVMILLIITFAPPLLERLIYSVFKTTLFHPALFLISPFTLLKTAWVGKSILPFWQSFWSILGLASLSFVIASVVTARWRHGITNESAASKKGPCTRAAKQIENITSKHSNPRKSQVSQRWDTSRHPFQFIADISQTSNRLLWTILGVGTIPFLWMLFKQDTMFLGIAFYSLFPFHLLIKVLLTSDACRRIHTDKLSGLLELLCTTPQPIYLLPYAYFFNLQKQYRRPAILLTLLNLLTIVGFVLFEIRSARFDLETFIMFSQVLGGGALFLFIDFHTLIWVSLKQGLTKKKLNRSIFTTLGRVMLPAWLGLFVLVGLLAGGGSQTTAMVFTLIWQLAALSYSWQLIRSSKAEIKQRFHDLVSQSSTSTASASGE